MKKKNRKVKTALASKEKNVKIGKPDQLKAAVAKGIARQAGMMLDGINTSNLTYTPGFVMESYRNSYASGLGYKSGAYDIPTFVQVMNQKNGGIIQFPMSLQERYSLFRYYARTDSLVGRALDLLSDLPMSKLSLHVPKYVPEGMKAEIKDFYEDQVSKLDLFNVCSSILYELNCIGNCPLFCEWNEEKKCWERIQMLPPEEVFVFNIGFTDEQRIEYRPRKIVSLITGQGSGNALEQEILDGIPQEIKDSVSTDGCIFLDSNPMNGSFCHFITRRKSPYMDLSSSILDRVLIPLQLKDYYKYTQLSLASRNMTPRNLITAVNCSPDQLDVLRAQVDMSMLDPDYSIVTNFEVNWQTLGSNDRLLELGSEYERLDNEIFSALGVTRELLTGEGSYSGTKITVEILNTMFLRSREILSDFIENKLFKTIAEKRGWYKEDKNGVKKYFYPKVSFNRLTIRDNSEVFQNMFQMYQKGSLPVEIIYELFNLDPSEMDDKLFKDLFTVRDSNFNEFIRGVMNDSGRNVVENSNVVEKIAKYLRLELKPQQEGGGGEGGGDLASLLGGAMGGGEEPAAPASPVPSMEQTETPPVEPQEQQAPEESFDKQDIEKKADEIASELPVHSEPEDIVKKIVEKEISWDSLTDEEKDALSDLVLRDLPEDASDDEIMKQIFIKTRGIKK